MSMDIQPTFSDQMFQAAQIMISMCPVPGVAAAVIVVQEIYRLVKNVSLREAECRELASYCGYIMWVINTQYKDVHNKIYARAVADLTEIITRVAADLHKWSAYNKGMRFVKNSEIGEAIAAHRKELDRCMAMVAFAQTTNQMSWNERFAEAQKQDNLLLNEVLAKQDELNDRVKEMQMMMKYWVPYAPGDPEGVNLTKAKDELFKLRHAPRKDTYTMPSRFLEGEVQKIGSRPAHAGSMYDIWKGIWLGEYTVALKVFRGISPREKDMKRIERQVDLWRAMKHRNILKLYGIVKLDHMQNPPIYFVSPWMKNKDAITYCKNTPNANRLRIIYDVAMGLEYIHDMGILHGGLQASNVLITRKGAAVLSDFSLSKVMDPGAMYTQSNGPSASLRWMSPEAHNAEVLTAQSDIYSWAMTALQVLSLMIPFYSIKAMGQLVVSIAVKKTQLQRADYPSDLITDELWQLFTDCWKFEPEQRPPITHILEVVGNARKNSPTHPWDGLPEIDDDDDAMDSEFPQQF